jgi:hypothetical protein
MAAEAVRRLDHGGHGEHGGKKVRTFGAETFYSVSSVCSVAQTVFAAHSAGAREASA